MKIAEITELLKATVYYMPDDCDLDVKFAGAADLMSDVLAYMGEIGHMTEGTVLITGLISPQVIRTATLMDFSVVLFTRGKAPTEDMIEAAKDNGIVFLGTNYTSYCSSGLLYSKGVKCIQKMKDLGPTHAEG